jgi:hypothetical protein
MRGNGCFDDGYDCYVQDSLWIEGFETCDDYLGGEPWETENCSWPVWDAVIFDGGSVQLFPIPDHDEGCLG